MLLTESYRSFIYREPYLERIEDIDSQSFSMSEWVKMKRECCTSIKIFIILVTLSKIQFITQMTNKLPKRTLRVVLTIASFPVL